MTIEFKEATKQDVSLIIGLAGASGSGKTYSALRLASGLSGGKKFAVIDTECGRAKHYADLFKFDHGELDPPFTPQAYLDAITAADNAGYPVIVIDSMSHEWMGEGGVSDWREEILDKKVEEAVKKWNSDPSKVRDSYAFASWAEPKRAHKQMVQKMLRTRAHLILCFRAEEKLKLETEEKDGRKKTAIVNGGWQPICEKNMPYELTLSILTTPDAPGKPNFLKLQEQHRVLLNSSKLIDENMGKKLLEWSAGTIDKKEQQQEQKKVAPSNSSRELGTEQEERYRARLIEIGTNLKAGKLSSTRALDLLLRVKDDAAIDEVVLDAEIISRLNLRINEKINEEEAAEI